MSLARRHSALSAGTVLFAATTACSVVAVRPDGYLDARTQTKQCNSYVPPALDLIAVPLLAAAGAGLAAFGRALSDCGNRPDGGNCGALTAVYIPALIAAGSSAYGFWGVTHCKNQLDRDPHREPEGPIPRAAPADPQPTLGQ